MKIDPSRNIPTATSEGDAWIQWHKDLKKVFNKKKANSVWLYAWSKRGGVNSKANTLNLSRYMKAQGVEIERTTLDEITESANDFAKGVINIHKWALIIGGTIAGLILLKILFSLNQNPEYGIRQAARFHPAGRALRR